MDETDIKNKIVTAEEVANFYKSYPGFWFLLKVLKVKEDGKAQLMKVANYNRNKDVLRDYLLEDITDEGSRYIFVYANPDGKCVV